MAKIPNNRLLRMQLVSRAALLRLAVLAIILGILMSWGWFTMIQMPGESSIHLCKFRVYLWFLFSYPLFAEVIKPAKSGKLPKVPQQRQ